ncbi:MAG: RodZ domain-containing protein [Sphingosinicella sp.]
MTELEEGVEPGPSSIGERLRLAREAEGLKIEDVADRTRIPIRHLLHIERGEWDALPAPTYCVGFARSYATTVGLDAAAIGRELREQLGDTRSRQMPIDFFEPADPTRVPPRWLAWVAAMLAIVLVTGYLVWRSTLDAEREPEVVPPPQASAPAAPRPAPSMLTPQNAIGLPVTLVATEEVWLRIDEAATGAPLFTGIVGAGQRLAVPASQRPVLRTGRPQVLRAMIGVRDIGPLEPAERFVADVSLLPQDLVARQQAQAAPAPSATPPVAAAARPTPRPQRSSAPPRPPGLPPGAVVQPLPQSPSAEPPPPPPEPQ